MLGIFPIGLEGMFEALSQAPKATLTWERVMKFTEKSRDLYSLKYGYKPKWTQTAALCQGLLLGCKLFIP